MMIKIKRLTEFPWELELGELASKEIAGDIGAAEFIMTRSRAWLISYNGTPLCLVGLLRLSIVGGAHRLWMVTFKNFAQWAHKALRFLRRAVRRLHLCVHQLSINIDTRFSQASRFALALGFVPSEQLLTGNGATYRSYYLR